MGASDGRGAAGLRDYLNVARRRKWIILQAVVLVPIAAALYSASHSPVYGATASVLLSRTNLANSLTGIQDPSQFTQDTTLVQTQAQLARVPEIARRSIVALGDRSMTLQEFLGESSVSTSPNTDIIGFHFVSGDPLLAARAATEYAQQYTQYRRGLDTASLEGARREVSNRIDQLVSQGDSRTALYTTLVEREQQLRTMEALQTSNANVVQTAERARKIGPRPGHAALLGLFLGIMLGAALAFLRETLDTRVRNAQEIGARLVLPLLARIPEPPKRLRSEDRLAMLDEPTGIHAEPFRVMRTNLEFATLGRDVKSIMITSAVEQEGKSTTIANLAIALARGGQNVILVDLDLRRPYLEKFFDLHDRPGITQVVLGRASLDEALVRVPIMQAKPSAQLRPRYDMSGGANGEEEGNGNGNGIGNGNGNGVHGRLLVLGSGPIPPDPGEFVASNGLAVVLAELRDSADIVLVDAPPVLHVGDAMVLSAKVDAMMLVTRMEKVRRPMLAEVHRVVDATPTPKLGFVITGAEAEDGYGYGYGYGHGYGHYGQAYEPNPVESRT